MRTQSFRFRLARFVASRVVHVGCPVIAAELTKRAIHDKAFRYAVRNNTCGKPATFAIA